MAEPEIPGSSTQLDVVDDGSRSAQSQKVRIAVLGPLRVDDGATQLSRRDRIALEALAIRPGQELSSDRLADALWGDEPPASATKVVQGCIGRLRKALGAEAIATSGSGYRLNLPDGSVDSQHFESLVHRGVELLALGEPERAAFLLDEALALFTGDPFSDLSSWETGVIEADRLVECRLSAEEVRLDALIRAGHHTEVLADAQSMVSAQPLRERRYALLALAQYRSGRQSEALTTLRSLRATLLEELAVDPGADVDALEHAILNQDPALLVEEPRALRESCPWPGLTAYDLDDSETFFGREVEVAMCLRLLRERRVLAVVGPSGSGKSSLVRAGVAAAVRATDHRVSLVAPGAYPAEAVDRVREVPADCLLVIDQCEEIFGPLVPPQVRDRFLEVLADHAREGQLVVAMRADRLAELSAYPGFARLLERGMYFLGAMNPDSLRAAVDNPARQAGLVVEPGLVDLLIREVQDEPGALPLLSHSLLETWNRREGRILTLDGYRASGGIRGSIAQSAESVYAAVPPTQQQQLHDLMMRLVSPGPEGEPLRTLMPRRRVVTDPEQEQLIELLVGARLLTSDDGNVTLAHESLARAWPRLRGWLDDDREGQLILHHLSASADAWQALGRPASELYRGVRLARAAEWSAAKKMHLAPVEQDFLDQSLASQAAEAREVEERAKSQARANRRLRGLLAIAAALLLVASVAGALAMRSSKQAAQSALAADAREVGARALLTDDTPKSLLLAVAAARLDPSTSTQADLQQALGRHPELIRTAFGKGSDFTCLDVSPDGTQLAAHDATGGIWLYDANSLKLEASYQAGEKTVAPQGNTVQFSPDGSELAVSATPAGPLPVRLLDPHTLQPLPRQLGAWPHQQLRVTGISYSGTGANRIAVGVDYNTPDGPAGVLLVWDRRTPGHPIARIPASVGGSQTAQISPDGTRVYTANPLAAYDVKSGRQLYENAQVGGGWNRPYLAPNPDSTRFVIISYHQPIAYPVVVDARTGRIAQRLNGIQAGANVVVWSPDGGYIAATSVDGLITVWNAETGLVDHTLSIEDGFSYGLDFSPDGSTLFSAGANRELQAWDLDGYHSYLQRLPLTKEVTVAGSFIRPSPDVTSFAYQESLADGTEVTFVDVDRDHTGRTIHSPDYWWGAGSWSPDGKRYASGYVNGVVRVFDARASRQIVTAKVGTGLVAEVDYTPDGKSIVIAQDTGDLTTLDASTLKPKGTPIHFDDPALDVSTNPRGHSAFVVLGGPNTLWYEDYAATKWALVDLDRHTVIRRGELGIDGAEDSASPDGRHAAVVGRQSQLEIVDTISGRTVVGPTGRQLGTINNAIYSPDGSRILAGSFGTARIWDATTGAQLGVAHIPSPATPYGAFRADGTILMASRLGHVYTWNPDLDHAIEFACQGAGRDLTRAEWAEAFPTRDYQHVCPTP